MEANWYLLKRMAGVAAKSDDKAIAAAGRLLLTTMNAIYDDPDHVLYVQWFDATWRNLTTEPAAERKAWYGADIGFRQSWFNLHTSTRNAENMAHEIGHAWATLHGLTSARSDELAFLFSTSYRRLAHCSGERIAHNEWGNAAPCP